MVVLGSQRVASVSAIGTLGSRRGALGSQIFSLMSCPTALFTAVPLIHCGARILCTGTCLVGARPRALKAQPPGKLSRREPERWRRQLAQRPDGGPGCHDSARESRFPGPWSAARSRWTEGSRFLLLGQPRQKLPGAHAAAPLWRRRRRRTTGSASKPAPPSSSIAQVEGSGVTVRLTSLSSALLVSAGSWSA